jgi:hypothetical protein
VVDHIEVAFVALMSTINSSASPPRAKPQFTHVTRRLTRSTSRTRWAGTTITQVVSAAATAVQIVFGDVTTMTMPHLALNRCHCVCVVLRGTVFLWSCMIQSGWSKSSLHSLPRTVKLSARRPDRKHFSSHLSYISHHNTRTNTHSHTVSSPQAC